MRFNKMTSYAIRVVAHLSLDDAKVITSEALSTKEHIPRGVLMKVLRQLSASGIVISHQGRGGLTGGFSLSEDIDKISIYRLIEAVEGDLHLYPVKDREHYEDSYEKIYNKLIEVNEEYKQKLDSIYIGDIL